VSYRLKAVSANRTKKRLRVLCVESDELLAAVLEYGLEYEGHLVESVRDGRTALGRVTQDLQRFNLIIADHRLPKLSGLQLATMLREAGFAGHIFVHSPQVSPLELEAYMSLSVNVHTGIVTPEWPRLLKEINHVTPDYD